MQNFYHDDRSKNKEKLSFQDNQQFSRAATPGRSLVENLKPISRKLDSRDDCSSAPKNDLTRHFKDFMSSNSMNLKRVRSFSQPKETKESQLKLANSTKNNNKTSEKCEPCMYLRNKETKEDSFSEGKTNFNFKPNDHVMRDKNNNNSSTNEGGREKIIYKKSKTSPLFSSVNSNCKFNGSTYSMSGHKNCYYNIDSKFSSSIENCMTYEITRKNQTCNKSLFSRDSWHRMHNRYNYSKVIYPVPRETFL